MQIDQEVEITRRLVVYWPALLTRSTILIVLIANPTIQAKSAKSRTAARVSFRCLIDCGQPGFAISSMIPQSLSRPRVSNARPRFAELNAIKKRSRNIRRNLADGDLSPRGLLLYSSIVIYKIYSMAAESKAIARRVEERCTQQGFSKDLLSSQAAKPRARVENVRTINRTISGKMGFWRIILFEKR